jgi:hypothetical protein
LYLPKLQEHPANEALGRRSALLRGLAIARSFPAETPAAEAPVQPTEPKPRLPDPAQHTAPAPTARPSGAQPRAERRQERESASPSIAVSCRVVSLVDDTCAAVLLSQLIYWSRRGREVVARDGWIYKTAREWALETGLTWKMQRRARRILVDAGLMKERLQAMPARLEFRLNLTALLPCLAERSEIEMPSIDWSWITDRDDPTLGRLLGRSFLFNAALTAHMSIPAAMMASRLMSAQSKRTGEEGRASFAYPKLLQLSREEWREETGLTRHQWQTARRDLHALGVLVERRHNFPRRVDLSLDTSAMAALLASPTGARRELRPKAGSVWAKQEGRFGHHPNRPADSPNPAFKDQPNPPIAIAQTGLYLSVQLQGQLHQQPHPGATVPVSWSVPQWGWGGLNSLLKKGQVKEPQSSAPATGAAPKQPDSLAWPDLFEPEDREAATQHLAGLDQAIQQLVLDEIDWQHAQKPVKSPIGLLRTLCKKALAGEFTADGAHRIAGARRRRQQALRAQDAQANKAARPSPDSSESADSAAAREKLRAMSAAWRRKAGSA